MNAWVREAYEACWPMLVDHEEEIVAIEEIYDRDRTPMMCRFVVVPREGGLPWSVLFDPYEERLMPSEGSRSMAVLHDRMLEKQGAFWYRRLARAGGEGPLWVETPLTQVSTR